MTPFRALVLTAPMVFVLPFTDAPVRAAPTSTCGNNADGSSADISPSLATQDDSHVGEATTPNGYAALRNSPPTPDCSPRLTPYGNPSSLRNNDADVMHGVPSSDSLAPIDQPKQAPMFR